jgi:hypothetical protein
LPIASATTVCEKIDAMEKREQDAQKDFQQGRSERKGEAYF